MLRRVSALVVLFRRLRLLIAHGQRVGKNVLMMEARNMIGIGMSVGVLCSFVEG